MLLGQRAPHGRALRDAFGKTCTFTQSKVEKPSASKNPLLFLLLFVSHARRACGLAPREGRSRRSLSHGDRGTMRDASCVDGALGHTSQHRIALICGDVPCTPPSRVPSQSAGDTSQACSNNFTIFAHLAKQTGVGATASTRAPLQGQVGANVSAARLEGRCTVAAAFGPIGSAAWWNPNSQQSRALDMNP